VIAALGDANVNSVITLDVGGTSADIGVAPTARVTGLDQLPGVLAACTV